MSVQPEDAITSFSFGGAKDPRSEAFSSVDESHDVVLHKLSSNPEANEKILNTFDQANEYFENEEWDKAIIAYTEVVQSPDIDDGVKNLGWTQTRCS
ncbi:MAG: hypothetical protein AAF571_08965 [Verrucomicrobiota bacterium]